MHDSGLGRLSRGWSGLPEHLEILPQGFLWPELCSSRYKPMQWLNSTKV